MYNHYAIYVFFLSQESLRHICSNDSPPFGVYLIGIWNKMGIPLLAVLMYIVRSMYIVGTVHWIGILVGGLLVVTHFPISYGSADGIGYCLLFQPI